MTNSVDSRQINVSVCLATYNGSSFLRNQVISILRQLGPEGELIAVDDASSDNTVAILESFHDPRIRILRHTENCGVIATFEHALREARGDILFLCDQDDIWHEDKVVKVLRAFGRSPEITLVMSNAELIDREGYPIGLAMERGGRIRLGVVANFIRNRYRGCTMAFRRDLLGAALPFPSGIPMHDSWIGLINAVTGKAEYIPEPLVDYRRHGNTVTGDRRGPILRIVAHRWRLLTGMLCRAMFLLRLRRRFRGLSNQDANFG